MKPAATDEIVTITYPVEPPRPENSWVTRHEALTLKSVLAQLNLTEAELVGPQPDDLYRRLKVDSINEDAYSGPRDLIGIRLTYDRTGYGRNPEARVMLRGRGTKTVTINKSEVLAKAAKMREEFEEACKYEREANAQRDKGKQRIAEQLVRLEMRARMPLSSGSGLARAKARNILRVNLDQTHYSERMDLAVYGITEDEVASLLPVLYRLYEDRKAAMGGGEEE